MTLIIFLSYSGKWDIMQAASRIAAEYASSPQRRAEKDLKKRFKRGYHVKQRAENLQNAWALGGFLQPHEKVSPLFL